MSDALIRSRVKINPDELSKIKRRLGVKTIKNEIDAIQEVLGKQVPMIGFYTYGEVAPLAGEIDPKCFSVFHNETMTLMVLGE